MMKNKRKYTKLVIFEFFHKTILLGMAYPFFVYGLRFLMKSMGIRYLTNNYFYRFISAPPTIVFMIVMLLLFGIGVMFELTCVDIMINLSNENKSLDLYGICMKGLSATKKVLRPRNICILLYCPLLCMITNMFITYHSFKSYDFADMVSNSVSISDKIFWIIAAVIAAAFVIVIYGFFTVNMFINNNGTFAECFCKSAAVVKKHFFKILIYIIGFNICSVFVYMLAYLLMSLLVIAGVYLLGIAHMGIAIYLTLFRMFRKITGIMFMVMSIPVSYILITKIYAKEMSLNGMEHIGYDVEVSDVPLWKKKLLMAIMTMSVAAAAFVIINTRTMDIFRGIELLNITQITSHRGSSKYCPENTMSAFNQAVDEMTDCIEIDIRQTLDGEFVIMHDLSLKRTTGVNQNVNMLTLEQIKELDAGSWKSSEYKGEKVPELSEVLDFAHGTVRLNIELKTSENDIDFAKKLVELIEEYGMEDECVVSSFDYKVLKEIKALNENIKTGYILSVAYGDYYTMDYVDFFSVNYSFVNSEMVIRAHDAGKKVSAWTVNSKKILKQMIDAGVDDIITDNPLLAREVIYSQNTSTTMLEMLQYVFDR